MPWTKSSLYVVEVTQSTSGLTFGTPLKIAGEGNESVSQPRWSLEGNVLVYLSDKSGYSELYRWSPDTGAAKPVLTTLTGADVGGELILNDFFDCTLIDHYYCD
jgi:Tol biopolymer transport system component